MDDLAGTCRASPPAKATQLGPDSLALVTNAHTWSGLSLKACPLRVLVNLYLIKAVPGHALMVLAASSYVRGWRSMHPPAPATAGG